MSEKLDELRRALTATRQRLNQSRQVLRRVDDLLSEGGSGGGELRPEAQPARSGPKPDPQAAE